jgi:hypothetical protein
MPAPTAACLSDGSTRSDATLNASPLRTRGAWVRWVRSQRSAAVRYGMANGRGRRMPNAWGFSSAATVPSPTSTACFASSSGTRTSNGGSNPLAATARRCTKTTLTWPAAHSFSPPNCSRARTQAAAGVARPDCDQRTPHCGRVPALIALPLLRGGGMMTWQLGWHVSVAWLLAVALAGVIYFVPMTRFVDNLSDRVVAAAE